MNDATTLRLSTLQVKVFLRGAQVADPELTSALMAFRRAANLLARLEDEIVFAGQRGPGKGPRSAEEIRTALEAKPHETEVEGEGWDGEDDAAADKPWEVRGGQRTAGLFVTGLKSRTAERARESQSKELPPGEGLVKAVSAAIGRLEERYHLGPFACVLGQGYFNVAQTPDRGSLVLPQDRILPFLGGGALLRTSTLPSKAGLIVALGGAPIELVVATDISVSFLQVTIDPWFVFRVYEKIVLRVKQPEAVEPLFVHIPSPDGASSEPKPKVGSYDHDLSW